MGDWESEFAEAGDRVAPGKQLWPSSEPTWPSLAAAIAQMRQGYAAKAINRMAEIIDSPNEGVALRAAQAIVGEDVKAPVVNVSVATQTNVQANIRPGYVLKLPANLEPEDGDAA